MLKNILSTIRITNHNLWTKYASYMVIYTLDTTRIFSHKNIKDCTLCCAMHKFLTIINTNNKLCACVWLTEICSKLLWSFYFMKILLTQLKCNKIYSEIAKKLINFFFFFSIASNLTSSSKHIKNNAQPTLMAMKNKKKN